MTPWSPDDDATLAELYRQFSARECAARMGRTRASIKGRLNKLRLRKPPCATNTGCFANGMTPWNKGKTTVEERDGLRITRHIAK